MTAVAVQARRSHVLQALARYWPRGREAIEALPIPVHSAPDDADRALQMIEMPAWASDVAPPGGLLVSADCLLAGDDEAWLRVDWLSAAFALLEASVERTHEAAHGPIHSYSWRLGDVDARRWERAWVNRIALFLRVWAAHRAELDEAALFGPRPMAEILLTHDVDAVAKTVAIRIKQGAFGLFNTVRALSRGRFRDALRHTRGTLRFALRNDQYDHLLDVAVMDQMRGLAATFHFHARARGGLRSWLFDPGYALDSPHLHEVLRRLLAAGHSVGLHPSFDAWQDPVRLGQEKRQLEAVLGQPVNHCRQHWLRFSWAQTWVAQRSVGLSLDTTLGFNDRPGFRNAAALRWHPWDAAAGRTGDMQAVPMLFMDSHFYDYLQLDAAARRTSMQHWLAEVRAVGGVISVLWHPHTLARDYGWRGGFVELLDLLGD